MDRLTTNNPENNLQTALNLFFVKDGQAWVRGGGPEPDYKDCSLYDYIRATMAGVLDPADVARMNIGQLTDEEIGSAMADWIMDGHCCIPGLIAHLYTAAWAFAEIRHRLAKYEDTGLTPEEITSLQNSYQQLQEINNRTYRSNMAMGEDLKNLKAELVDERHRHDRYVDFELAEAEELRKAKAERDAMLADLKRAHSCSSCKHNDDTERPECMIIECEFCENCHCYACVDGDNWEWRGAKDNNVPGKKEV